MEAFIAAGLYDAEAPNAPERRDLLEYLMSCGYTAEQICSVSLSNQPVTDLLAVLQSLPVEYLSATEIANEQGGGSGRATPTALGASLRS